METSRASSAGSSNAAKNHCACGLVTAVKHHRSFLGRSFRAIVLRFSSITLGQLANCRRRANRPATRLKNLPPSQCAFEGRFNARIVETFALILTFSPGEKEQRLSVSRFADGHPANPVTGFRVSRRKILLGEKGGMREVVTHYSMQWKSGGERAAVQTLCEVRKRPVVAKRLDCACL